ncbi:hypothetical protein [uncultured Chryseobacterium sp.]|uniref:hypothetical protein n=1 Tax=uncultured Chryseobacterium sp. TaxID=259322 RepID=UPI00258B06BB|nr:hypothetical protein [uncultured Chryseobacterium sp.]
MEQIIDCRSEEGITIGLIDSLISIARVLAKRDLDESRAIKEALKDLINDEDIDKIISHGKSINLTE